MGGRRKTAVHAYDRDEMDRLKGVPLPEKVRCGRCHKNLPQAKYSTKQLTDARWQVKNQGRIEKPINCHHCTGQQKVEVECIMCGKTKGLDEFAKSQRAKPDTAKCYKCIEIQLADAPVDEEKYEQPETAFMAPDHSKGVYPEYWSSAASSTDASSAYGDNEWDTVNGNAQRKVGNGGNALSGGFQRAMSLNDSTDDSFIQTEYASAGDGWSEVRTKSWHTQSNAAPSGSTASSFNPNAYRGSSARSFASSVAERSEIRSNAWAKIPAAPRNPTYQPCRPGGDSARETGSGVDAWDSDEEDEKRVDDDSDDDSDDDTVI